jgi:hypothetical protein
LSDTWRCAVCGCTAHTIPHTKSRSSLCDWCADELVKAGKRWCGHCHLGVPLAQWASPHAKRCQACTREYDAQRDRTAQRSRAIAAYHADPDRFIYRMRLKQIASRRCSRADQVFRSMRKRIALARIVSATKGWSWTQRARRFGGYPNQLATDYRRQCAGLVGDVDNADRAREAHWRAL